MWLSLRFDLRRDLSVAQALYKIVDGMGRKAFFCVAVVFLFFGARYKNKSDI